ncbi:MAG TPA: glutamine-hydrolyzing carbamoyl-phosphate synthase small subunit, partial [Bacteroidota bacterium]
MKAKLALENGQTFAGESFGSSGEVSGEVVFNTSMTGYQEILTDPSYCGQIVTMTYPLIGNYGVNDDDLESDRPQVSGFVVKEYIDYFSNWRAKESLAAWLKRHRVIAIQGLDTRMLTKMIRTVGALRGVISTEDLNDLSLVEKARGSPKMAGLDLTKRVTTAAAYAWNRTDTTPYALKPVRMLDDIAQGRFRVVVYDYGVKRNILRRLTTYGCDLTVVPSAFPAEKVLSMQPDGIFLSNGPGDPDAVKYAIGEVKKLIGKRPIFGICLGLQ